ncbi:MAG: permease [Formivibrio sp.]|nr:permease [Formivibrio sp.]
MSNETPPRAHRIIPIKAVSPLPQVSPPRLMPTRLVLGATTGLLLWIVLYSQLDSLADWLAFGVLSLQRSSHLGEAARFFIFDTPKVLLLLTLVVFAMGVLHTFFSPQRTRAMLAGKHTILGNISAASLGIVTPFCSCSAVPLFIGFLTAGVPLGVTFSFLISAPMVNEVALALLFGLFGWKVAGTYLLLGLGVAIVAGVIIGLLKLESWVEPWVYQITAQAQADDAPPDWGSRIQSGLDYVKEIVGKVWPYLVAGIALGAGIHGYVPENALAAIMGKEAWWSVPLAVLMGVPMYSNAAGMIPVVQALLGKGAALGTVLAFMMSVTALSLPEMIILRKVLSVKLITVFASVVALGILTVGYVFNALF